MLNYPKMAGAALTRFIHNKHTLPRQIVKDVDQPTNKIRCCLGIAWCLPGSMASVVVNCI